MNSATSTEFWPTWKEMPSELWKYPPWVSLGTFEKPSEVKAKHRAEIHTVTLQGKFRSGAAGAGTWWWATTMPDLISCLWSTRPLRNRTQRTPFSLSILALWWPSAPGIAAMWAWLHGTISVCSATWHWEAGIRWLHYCKWLVPVTHANTRTRMCAFANSVHIHTCNMWNLLAQNLKLVVFIYNLETTVVSILSLAPCHRISLKYRHFFI